MKSIFYTITLLSVGVLIGLTINNSVYLKKLDKEQTVIQQTFVDILKLQEANNNSIFVIQDTLIRIFHYTKPHKEPINGCPECAEFIKEHLKVQSEQKTMNKGN